MGHDPGDICFGFLTTELDKNMLLDVLMNSMWYTWLGVISSHGVGYDIPSLSARYCVAFYVFQACLVPHSPLCVNCFS